MIAFHEPPILAPSLRTEWLEFEGLLFFDDRQFSTDPDPAARSVVALVDGKRSKAEIIEEAGRAVGDMQALLAFQRLEAGGKLLRAPESGEGEAITFWHAIGGAIPGSLERLATAHVTVHTLSKASQGVHAAQFAQALRGAGVGRVEVVEADRSIGAAAAALEVWIVDDYLRPELEAINKQRVSSKTRWCLLNVWDAAPSFGPCFEPDIGPCWACLAYRLRINRPIDEYLRRVRRRSAPLDRPHAAIGASEQMMMHSAALTVAMKLAGNQAESAPSQHLLALDCSTMRLEHHYVPRRPQCAVCGDPDLLRKRSSAPLELHPRPKTALHDGGYRQFSARETVTRLLKQVSPRVGAVTHLEPIPGRPASHAVFVSGYLVPPQEEGGLSSCLRTCAGKGQSVEQAKASALCEALERHSGEWQGDEARIRGASSDFGEQCISLDSLLCFSERQYRDRERLNAESRHRSQWIPTPLPASTAIDWTPAWSLSAGSYKHVPFCYCYAGAPPEAGSSYCRSNGNGVAAGSCLEEAILQAIFELVERDAVAIWWYNRVPRPAFQLAQGPDGYSRAIVREYEAEGAHVSLLDLTHDFGIPVCAAISERQIAGRPVLSVGFGCHLQAEIAVQRALTELNQLGNGLNPGTGEPLLQLPVGPRHFLRPSQTASKVPVAAWHSPDLKADIDECLRRLAPLEVLVVDKSRPDFDVRVAQVIIPTLRHFWPRFGAGRLYQVPAQLGWLKAACSEAELNTASLTL
ncbi:MAG TPA: TOMM precursor leader peptide-binding protein [Polyangiaceae bacterium]|nr:TOMM precursor leader peptide-binding protein [Polyangiaceae bacterium]